MAQKKKYRIYKAGGQHGRIINPTAKFLMKAEAGMQQPTPAEMIMMQEQQMGQQPMGAPSPEEMQMMQQAQGQPPMQGMPPQPSDEERMMMEAQQEMQELIMSVKEALEVGTSVEEIIEALQEDGHSSDKIKFALVESGISEEEANVLVSPDEVKTPDAPELDMEMKEEDVEVEEVPEETDRAFVKRRVKELKKAKEGLEANKDTEDGLDVKNTFRSNTFDIPEGGRKDLVSGFLSGINDSVQTHQFEQQAENELMQAKTGREMRQEMRANRQALRERRRAGRQARRYGLDPFLFAEEGTFHGEKGPLGLGLRSFDITWKNATPMPYHFYDGITNPFFNGRGYYTNVAKKIIAPGEELIQSEIQAEGDSKNVDEGTTFTWDDVEKGKAPAKSESSNKQTHTRRQTNTTNYWQRRQNPASASISSVSNPSNDDLNTLGALFAMQKDIPGGEKDMLKFMELAQTNPKYINNVKKTVKGWNAVNKQQVTKTKITPTKVDEPGMPAWMQMGLSVAGATTLYKTAEWVFRSVKAGKPVKPSILKWLQSKGVTPPKPGTTQSFNSWLDSNKSSIKSKSKPAAKPTAKPKVKPTTPKPKVKAKAPSKWNKFLKGSKKVMKGAVKGMKGINPLMNLDMFIPDPEIMNMIMGRSSGRPSAQIGGFVDSTNPDLYKFIYGGDEAYSGIPQGEDINDPYIPFMKHGGPHNDQIRVVKETLSGRSPSYYHGWDQMPYALNEDGTLAFSAEDVAAANKAYFEEGDESRLGDAALKAYPHIGPHQQSMNVVYADANNPEAAFAAGDRFGDKELTTMYMSPASARNPVGSYDQQLQAWSMSQPRTNVVPDQVLYDNKSLDYFPGETKGEYYGRMGGPETVQYMIDKYDMNPEEMYNTNPLPSRFKDPSANIDPNTGKRGPEKYYDWDTGTWIEPYLEPRPVEEYPNIESYATGGQLDTYQGDEGGNQIPRISDQALDYILDYEAAHGSPHGLGLSNYGIQDKYRTQYPNILPASGDISRDQARQFLLSDQFRYGDMQQFPLDVQRRLLDYSFNTGRNFEDLLLLDAGLTDMATVDSSDPADIAKLKELYTENQADILAKMGEEGYASHLDKSKHDVYKSLNTRRGYGSDPSSYTYKDSPYARTWSPRIDMWQDFKLNEKGEVVDQNTNEVVVDKDGNQTTTTTTTTKKRMRPQVRGYRYNPTGGAFFTQGNPRFDRYNAFGRINPAFGKRPSIFNTHTYMTPLNDFARNLPPEALASLMKSGKAGVIKRGMFRGRDPETGLRLPKREAYIQWGDGVNTPEQTIRDPKTGEILNRAGLRQTIRGIKDGNYGRKATRKMIRGERKAFRDARKARRRGFGDDYNYNEDYTPEMEEAANAEWVEKMNADRDRRLNPDAGGDQNAPYYDKRGEDMNPLNRFTEEEAGGYSKDMGSDNMRYGGFFNHGGTHPDQQPNPYGNTPMGQGLNTMMNMFGNNNNMQTQLQSSANFQANPQFTPQNTGASPQTGGSNFSYSAAAPPMIDENNNGIPDTIERPSDEQPMIGPQNKPKETKGGKARFAIDNAYDINLSETANMGKDLSYDVIKFANTLGSSSGEKDRFNLGLDDSINYGEDLGLKKVNTQGKDQVYQDNRADVQYVSAKYGGDVSNMYEEGEEYDLTLEELAEILANGGNVEFL